jgi:hypothetical protein
MTHLNRRLMLAGAAATLPGLAPTLAWAQETKAQLGTPRSVITNPPRDFGPGAPPPGSPDPVHANRTGTPATAFTAPGIVARVPGSTNTRSTPLALRTVTVAIPSSLPNETIPPASVFSVNSRVTV